MSWYYANSTGKTSGEGVGGQGRKERHIKQKDKVPILEENVTQGTKLLHRASY